MEINEVILQELREHRKESSARHDRLEGRVRSLENSRAISFGIVSAVSAGMSFIVSFFSGKG